LHTCQSPVHRMSYAITAPLAQVTSVEIHRLAMTGNTMSTQPEH
jgi:hypothetical protein